MTKQISRFPDRLRDAILRKKSYVVVGLDPNEDYLPSWLVDEGVRRHGSRTSGVCCAIAEFNMRVIDAVAPYAVAVKPQLAYYEQYGSGGISVYEKTISYAREKGLLVIADAKRNDIGSTAEAYAKAYLGDQSPLSADAVTVNPFFGTDGLKPFIDQAERNGGGVFVLCRTSNPSAPEIQDMGSGDCPVYCKVAVLCDSLGRMQLGESGYSAVGLVVGATYPKEAALIRKLAPRSFFLVPGYGAQGAGAQDVLNCFNEEGMGAIVNSSRNIIYAYKNAVGGEKRAAVEFEKHAALAAERMRDEINGAVDGRYGLPF